MIRSFFPESGSQPPNAKQPHGPAGHAFPPQIEIALERAAACIQHGGVAVYPTSTFLAVGGLAANARAASLVYELKGRPSSKPLPLLAANMEQAQASVNLENTARKLAERFWPGPLTILAPAKDARAGNSQVLAAIRMDGNPLAMALARLAGGALTASSANVSGQPAVTLPAELAPEFLRRLAALGNLAVILPVPAAWRPLGGLPSTIVEVVAESDGNALRILRPGAIARETLEQAGYNVL